MNKLVPNIPSQLSEISFNSTKVINIKIGWDFKYEMLEFHPVIHLFYKNGKRIDLVSFKKRSTQGVKLISNDCSYFDIELDMKKLPSYVDSLYISLGSVDSSKNFSLLKDLYFQISQGKNSEIWGQSHLTTESPTIILSALEKLDQTLVKGEVKPSWSFNFLVNSIPPDLNRIESIITKSDLFHLPTQPETWFSKMRCCFINLLSKLFNVSKTP